MDTDMNDVEFLKLVTNYAAGFGTFVSVFLNRPFMAKIGDYLITYFPHKGTFEVLLGIGPYQCYASIVFVGEDKDMMTAVSIANDKHDQWRHLTGTAVQEVA